MEVGIGPNEQRRKWQTSLSLSPISSLFSLLRHSRLVSLVGRMPGELP